MSFDLKVQEFDRNTLANVGRPNYFNVEKYLSCVEEMITCDEVEKALWMLENMPAWYRDHYPVEAKQIKDRLLTQFFTTNDYSKDPVPPDAIGALEHDLDRGQVVVNHCRKIIQEHGLIPHIVEIGPGNYWLPFVLKKENIAFTYFGQSLEPNVQAMAKEKLKPYWAEAPMAASFSMFVAFEMIEHLHNPIEIYQSYLKLAPKDTKAIFLSTPRYTFGGGMGEWYTAALGHLRAYTPKEFADFAMKYWPEFKWTMYDGHVMCLVGERE